MTLLRPSAAWRASLAAAANAPPLHPRVPLWCGAQRIGSVEPELFPRAGLASSIVRPEREGWALGDGEPTDVLDAIAQGLRVAGLAHTWRNEQLAVRGEDGVVVGTVERGVVRALGIATDAVHLTALTPSGRIWVQQRAFDKPTDPGRWDTLVGGLVPAGEDHATALAREAWEEAGLRPGQLQDLRAGGCVRTTRPLPEQAHGYVVEDLHWFVCTLAADVTPSNQDGEVISFACLPAAEIAVRLQRGAFTIDAGLVLMAAHGAPVGA